MAEAEEKPAASIPEWQRAQNNANETDKPDEANQSNHDQPAQSQPEEEDKFVVARRFLADDEVKNSSRERKVAFLKSKGIDDAEIENLLQEAEPSPTSSSSSSFPITQSEPTPSVPSSDSSSVELLTSSSSRAPVVTYPEFLTPKDDQNAPLLTRTNLLTILQVFTVLSTLIAGTSRFVLSPMLDRLTDARVDLHTSASESLQPLIEKLEKIVSKVPSRAEIRKDIDEDSDSDPTEMFHRDVGTQTTSFTPTNPVKSEESGSEAQTTRLEKFNLSLREMEQGMGSQTDSLGDVKTLIDVFRDDLDTLTYPSVDVNNYDSYSRSRKPEPEDEIRKVRDSIRRIKGTLLTSRSFPTSTRQIQ